MYPNLYYFFYDVFGVNIPFLKVINTFGFMVAMAFLGCAWLLTKELKRKQAKGQLSYTETKIKVGEPAGAGELISNFVVGFLFGFKLLGLFLMSAGQNDPQGFLFSTQGSWVGGNFIGWFALLFKMAKQKQTKTGKT